MGSMYILDSIDTVSINIRYKNRNVMNEFEQCLFSTKILEKKK